MHRKRFNFLKKKKKRKKEISSTLPSSSINIPYSLVSAAVHTFQRTSQAYCGSYYFFDAPRHMLTVTYSPCGRLSTPRYAAACKIGQARNLSPDKITF
jgi:hypothetical protein